MRECVARRHGKIPELAKNMDGPRRDLCHVLAKAIPVFRILVLSCTTRVCTDVISEPMILTRIFLEVVSIPGCRTLAASV